MRLKKMNSQIIGPENAILSQGNLSREDTIANIKPEIQRDSFTEDNND